MKQTLQLKLTQHLTLTPQLQQSIRLLQLSTIELNAEVERMLQENPLLEKVEGEEEAAAPVAPRGEVPASAADSGAAPESTASAGAEERRDVEPASFDDYAIGDSDWGGGSGATDDDDGGLYPQQVATTSLRDHLMDQLAVLNLPLRDRQIVAALIDAVDEDGYLQATQEELTEIFPEDFAIEPDEIAIGLRFLQSFEPAGVGARDAAECLALQLRALPETTPYLALATKVVKEHLPLLAARDFTRLKRLLHTDDDGLRGMRALVMGLNPRPGAS